MKPLFTLLCLGLETRRTEDINYSSFCELSQEDWEKLRNMAGKQGVSAIVFDGLSLLVKKLGREIVVPQMDACWWDHFVMSWTSVMVHTEIRNAHQREVLENMASQWKERGCRVMVFKGLASATMYPKPNHRNPGDIDCYLFENYNRGNEIAKGLGAKVDGSWYRHSKIAFRGEKFENHQFFVHTREGKRSKALEKELEDGIHRLSENAEYLAPSVIMPTSQWNAMFLVYHACTHFLSEGMKLKQILDWAMFLQKYQHSVDWKAFYAYCERYYLRRFADAMTAICVEYLGVEITCGDIETTSPYVEKILNSTLDDDDYVYNSGKSRWHKRIHVVRNMFRYRWKYEEICQDSVWRQLWYYVYGYLFHTEGRGA